jgi:glutamate/aspartate transport system substrate-binding protein
LAPTQVRSKVIRARDCRAGRWLACGALRSPWTFGPGNRRILRLDRRECRPGAELTHFQELRMRTSNITLALALLAFCAMPVAAQESPTLKKIKDTGTITIGHRDSSIPFSYYDDKQNVVGYALDICMKVVDSIKAELKMPNLQVKLNPVTSATRIPLIANGTVDLECGSTTNNLERQNQVAFTNTYFLTANRFVSKKANNLKAVADLKGKTVVSTSGTTNLKQITEMNGAQNMGMSILTAKDHAEAFLMVETDRANAFFMDDILLYSLVANSKSPADYVISADALSVEPYGAMMRKDDPVFKKLVDTATANLYKSGQINALYTKWFLSPIPPKGVNLNVPMSDALKKAFANPTDSGDPAAYK